MFFSKSFHFKIFQEAENVTYFHDDMNPKLKTAERFSFFDSM